jgi:hypothetical protein
MWSGNLLAFARCVQEFVGSRKVRSINDHGEHPVNAIPANYFWVETRLPTMVCNIATPLVWCAGCCLKFAVLRSLSVVKVRGTGTVCDTKLSIIRRICSRLKLINTSAHYLASRLARVKQSAILHHLGCVVSYLKWTICDTTLSRAFWQPSKTFLIPRLSIYWSRGS